MTKINDATRQQIAALEAEYKNLAEQKRLLERKDWFLIDVKFTPESLADYQTKLKAYPDVLAAWQQAAANKPENEKTFRDIWEPFPPFPPSTYDLSDLFDRELSNCHIETKADRSAERYAVRACEFAALEKKPHILSITVVDQGESVAALVDKAQSEQQAERLAELRARRPAAPSPAATGDAPPAP